MDAWAVQTSGLTGTAQNVAQCQAALERISTEINNVRSTVSRQCPALSASCSALSGISNNVHRQSTLANELSTSLQNISQKYESVETALCNGDGRQPHASHQGGGGSTNGGAGRSDAWVDAIDWSDPRIIGKILPYLGPFGPTAEAVNILINGTAEEKKNDIKLLSKSGLIGSIIATGLSCANSNGSASDILTTISYGLDSLKNIDNLPSSVTTVAEASGAEAKWAELLGLAPHPLDYGTDFFKNLSGTFTDTLKGSIKTPFGLVGTAVTVASEGFENHEEYKSGKISRGRAIAETAVESGVKIVVRAGSKAIATAALGAICGTVGAPAVAIGVGGLAITWAADGVCQWLTGLNGGESRKLDEFISDTVIDSFTKPDGMGRKAVDAVGGVISNAVDGVKTGWSSLCSWLSEYAPAGASA